jgi:hypothetical protein
VEENKGGDHRAVSGTAEVRSCHRRARVGRDGEREGREEKRLV